MEAIIKGERDGGSSLKGRGMEAIIKGERDGGHH